MTAPTIHAEKTTTPEGQEQVFQFFILVPATAENGDPVTIRQQVTRTTISQLDTQVAKATEMKAAAIALG